MKYQFRHESWGDDWQDFEDKAWDAESAAEKIAEQYWSDDPSDPHRFEFVVEIKDEKDVITKFNVTAEASVNFYARETK